MTISLSEAEKLLNSNDTIYLCNRGDCSCEVMLDGRPHMFSKVKVNSERNSCYFMGVFREKNRNYGSYGKVIEFIEHKIGSSTHFMVYASWITNGLNVGDKSQIYSSRSTNSSKLFSCRTVESVTCIKQSIGIVRSQVPNRSNSISNRTYFFNPV